eukprot:Em0820g2a
MRCQEGGEEDDPPLVPRLEKGQTRRQGNPKPTLRSLPLLQWKLLVFAHSPPLIYRNELSCRAPPSTPLMRAWLRCCVRRRVRRPFGHRRSTVTARSLSGGASFAIPLNSLIRFGLLYEPKEEYNATTFATVGDILDALPMPKVVCAQKSYVGDRIALFCTGNFTTSPRKVQLPLRDIVAGVKDPFPSKAWPFAENEEMAKCFSAGFFANAVSLVALGETLTVIVTPVQASDRPGKERSKETNTLKENYDERKISYVMQASKNEQDRDQAQLFRHVLLADVRQKEPSEVTLTTLQAKYEVLADDMRSISLLSSMEMDQYRETFAAERVDGKIFAELDETVMEQDLKITSSTDRLKLVMVINGQLRP